MKSKSSSTVDNSLFVNMKKTNTRYFTDGKQRFGSQIDLSKSNLYFLAEICCTIKHI